MKKDKVDKVKESKLFRWWDILVYAILICLILVLLWAFIWRTPKGEISGVEVLIKDNIVLSYDFDKKELIKNSENIEILEEDNKIIAKVYIDDDKKHFNQVVIDVKGKEAYIEEANCSQSKDCTKMNHISKSGESIICVPHQLILRAKGEDIIKDPISG